MVRVLLLSLFVGGLCLTAADKDACSLVTAADAEAALGEPVGAPTPELRPSPPGQASACRFRSTQSRGLKAKTVSVSVHYATEDLHASMPGMMDNLKSAGYQNVHSVAGVGEEAIWASRVMMGKTTGELTVRKGKSTLVVIIINGLPDDATALDHAKALAAKVLPKA